MALALLSSFLKERRQTVTLDQFKSTPYVLPCGVPQGSLLSPSLSNINVSELTPLIQHFGFSLTSFADDTQIVVVAYKDQASPTLQFQNCMVEINRWMGKHGLKLNSEKTEVLIFGNLQPRWDGLWWPAEMGELPKPVQKAKILGVLIENKLTLSQQTNAIVSASYHLIKKLKKILPYIPVDSRRTVVTALVLSKLDYCNRLYQNLQKQKKKNYRWYKMQP